MHDLGKAVTPRHILPKHIGHEYRGVRLVKNFCEVYGISGYALELAVFACENHIKCHTVFQMRSSTVLKLLQNAKFDIYPKMLKDFVTVCKADSMGKLNSGNYLQGDFLLACQKK